MISPKEKPTLVHSQIDGNAFAVLGAAKKALKGAGADKEYIDQYMEEAMSGDYNHLLVVTMKHINFI